jgi:hypothetical protein
MKAADGVHERLAADEAHGIAGLARVVGGQAVDRDDTGVLQPGRDLGLLQKAAAVLSVVGAGRPDALEGDLAAQLLVAGQVDLAQAALSVETEGPVAHRRRRRPRSRVRPGWGVVDRGGRAGGAARVAPQGTDDPVAARFELLHPGQAFRAAVDVSGHGLKGIAGQPAISQGQQQLTVGTCGGGHERGLLS